MRIVILGGTGSIGSAVTRHLVAAGHLVTGLARSPRAAKQLKQFGATSHIGDICAPQGWAHLLEQADALIHLAATFDDQMAIADQQVVQTIIAAAQQRQNPLRVLYTGGVWLYGETGDLVAREANPLRPIAPFAFMSRHSAQLHGANNLSVATVHPALVYHGTHDPNGGAFSRFVAAAQTVEPIEVWRSVNTRWPLVEREDLAAAYALLVDRSDLTGSFNVAAEEAVRVQEILNHICPHYGHDGSFIIRNEDHVIQEFGPLAHGPMLDQQMNANKIVQATGWNPKTPDFRAVFAHPIPA